MLSIFAMVSDGVDRCLFLHRDPDADVKPPVTRTEEEIGVELAVLWKTVSKLASSLTRRTGQLVDVPVPQVMEEPTVKQFDDLHVLQVVEESTVEWSDGFPVCGDGTEGSDVGVHGEQVKEAVGEVVVELAVPFDEARSFGPGSVIRPAPPLQQSQSLLLKLGLLDL